MPKKAEVLKARINSIFHDESDDEEYVNKRPKIPQKKMTEKSSIKSASDVDPTIYEYDSIYDDMKAKEVDSSGPKEVKKSRYIETLLKAADKRKKEYERRVDRKIQIEREKEGDEFKDKEAFVTSSYKKKLQEKEEEEERERRENMLNDMMDVTKQKDLSGFYRHFLNQTIGEEKVPLFGEKQIKKEVESDHDSISNKVNEFINCAENLDRDSDGIEIDNEDDDSEREFSSNEKSDCKEKNKKTFTKRTTLLKDKRKTFKKQTSSNNVVDKTEKSELLKHDKTFIRNSTINSNLDVTSSDEDSETTKKSLPLDKVDRNLDKSRHDSSSSDEEHSIKSANHEVQVNISREEQQKNIYAKRTIGDVFAEAQARYFQRLAMRNS